MRREWQRRRLQAVGPGHELGSDVYELAAAQDGPVVVVLGGVHGDELEGAVAAGRLTSSHLPLRRGLLRVVPVCNEEAFRAGTRSTPGDGLNLARVFPGDVRGRSTEQLAAALTESVLRGVDCLIDLHTAGRCYDMPALVGFVDNGTDLAAQTRVLAMAFGFGMLWAHGRYEPGRTVTVVGEAGGAALYVECPGGEVLRARYVDAYVAGVLDVLRALKMLSPDDGTRPDVPRLEVAGDGNLDRDVIRASHGGIYVGSVKAGQHVAVGQRLGTIFDLYGREQEVICSPLAGHVMYLRRCARIEPSEAIACIAAVAHKT